VLFSRTDVANYINTNFEPVWQSIRPVPVIRIDFGNGNVVTRTLHGNIASYVCRSDGQVLDILPGIYTPAAYLDCLEQFRLLAAYVDQPGAGLAASVESYHRTQAEALHKQTSPARLFVQSRAQRQDQGMGMRGGKFGGGMGGMRAADMGKGVIERRTERILLATSSRQTNESRVDGPTVDTPEDRSHWMLLAEDTLLNESIRRQQIHEKLAKLKSVSPQQITRWLYKEVLHADIDDPYLGLGGMLFAHYPFKQEDMPAKQ
jgi:hypothetical protein